MADPFTSPTQQPVRLQVPAEAGGRRLDDFLAERLPRVSRMRLRRALEAGEVRVDGVPSPPGHHVTPGERVEVTVALDVTDAMTPEPLPLEVVHEDPHLAVVRKPAGLVIHPAGRYRTGTLANALAYHFNVRHGADPPIRPGIVHRLDRATSGLVVVAKTQRALSRLTVQFQERRVDKRYVALVHGEVPEAAGEWHAPIGCDLEAFPRWGIRAEGRPAHTRWEVRERLPGFTLLELEPVTGRTNQLRLHGSHFGHPIVGDDLFGPGPESALGRLFLQAYRLAFAHPETGERLWFEEPLEPPLREYVDRLRAAG